MTGRPRVAFLDAGGVLVEPDWGRVADVLAKAGFHADPDALAAAEGPAKRALDDERIVRGTDDRKRGGLLFRRTLAIAGLDAGDREEEFIALLLEEHARANLWCRVPAGVAGALECLRGAGIGRVVVSNSDGKVGALLDDLGLGAFMDDVVDSGAVGIEKPDPAIFRIALERCGARPEDVVHVGDLFAIDVAGARAAGIHAVLVDPADAYADQNVERHPNLAAWVDHMLGD